MSSVHLRPQESTIEPRPLDAVPVPAPRRGWPVVAWLIILSLVGYLVYRNATHAVVREGERSTAWLLTVQSQGRYLVGVARLAELLGQKSPDLAETARTNMDQGPYSQRLRYAVVAGELAGPARAREALEELETDRRKGELEARDVSIHAARLLRRLYAGYEKDPNSPAVDLSESEQQTLREGLGWFGDLALTPAGSDPAQRTSVLAPAVRTAVTYMVVGVAILLGLAAGLVLLIVLLLCAFLGKLGRGLVCGSQRGGIYAETFAVYMLVYFGLGLLASRTLADEGVRRILEPYGLVLQAGMMLLSLAALAWPVLRGVPWRQVRQDVGLSLNGRPVLNVLFGPLTYLSALPLLAVGLAIMFGMMTLQKRFGLGDPFQPGAGPSHPIISVATQKNWLVWLQVFVLASIAAPIVEEIMFRGVLYRHLREASDRWGRWLSVLASVLLSSFVFAVIHPQGWLGVPVLMGLAIAFALAREWRQSLVPPMIAHGLNNGFATLMLFLLAS